MKPAKTAARISVAMCTYNGTQYLEQQLGSIAAQTHQPFELVIADDRSTDGTLDLLENFARTCAFPVRIHQNATQLGSTRNFNQVIRLCEGEYIALSDQDDRWLPEKLAQLGEILDSHPESGMVFSDATLIDDASQETGKTLWQAFRFPQDTRARFAADPGAVLLQRPVVTGATLLFRRSLLDHFTLIPAPWVHDGWITWMSVLWAKPLFTEQPLTEYRIHASQQLGVGQVSLMSRVQVIRRHQRALYASIATEFDMLLRYIEQETKLAQREDWLRKVAKSAEFFRERSEAPSGLAPRLLFLMRHMNSYRALSGPVWRVLLRDLFMGTLKTG